MTQFLQGIPPQERKDLVDQFCLKYPVWFFELLTEVDNKPFELERFQIKYLLDDSTFKISNKTRQAGGSLIVSADKFWDSYRNPNKNCDIVSINQREAQSKITYIKGLWESLPRRWRHPLCVDNTFNIGFHAGRNRSLVSSIAASAGVRGGKKSIFFDEAAHIEKFRQLYVAALPATIRNNGGFDVVSTPLGVHNLFEEIWNNQNGLYGSWSRHFFLWFQVSFFVNAGIDEIERVWVDEYQQNMQFMPMLVERFATDRLKEYYYTLPFDDFRQEYCGEFVDETTSYYPMSIIQPCLRHDEPQPKPNGDFDHVNVLERWKERPADNDHPIYIGIDFAEGRKGGDETSIQVIERLADGQIRHRASFELSGTKWNDLDLQIDFIGEVIRKFRPQSVRVDETGLGTKIAKDLKKIHGSMVECVNFHLKTKEEMALGVYNLLQGQRIWLPHDNRPLQAQIHAIKRTITNAGNITYSGEPHDDMFWALALACKGEGKTGFRIITY